MGKIVTLDNLRRSKVGPELYRHITANKTSISSIKILIGMLTSGPMVHFQTMMDMMNMLHDVRMVKDKNGRSKYATLMAHKRATNIPTGRNEICERALETGAEYILMLDSDMAFPNHSLRQLLALDKDIVSALAVKKDYPYEPVMGNKADSSKVLAPATLITSWEEGELLKVDGVGTAFFLFKTSVLQKMKWPYFHHARGDECDGGSIGSDMYFCFKAGEAGFDVFVDTSLKIGHIGDYAATIDDFYACRAVPAKVKEAKLA